MSLGCRIAIIGGGLAGIATAQALKTFAIEAEVFETAPALGEIGAAVNTSPQAVKALRAIGVGNRIAAVGHLSPGIYTRNMQTGEFLEFNDRFKLAERYGAPYYSFHRADLLDALASGLEQRAVHLGHRLAGIEERGGGVILIFANGARVEADYVIGADGVRSVLRQTLYGADNPAYTGQMVWRSLLNAGDVPQEVLDPTGHTQWVGPGRHLLAYKIRQGKLVNIVTQQDTDKWVEEGWSTRGDPDEMRVSPQLRTAPREAFEPRHRVLKVGAVHAPADAQLGPWPHPAHRRRSACHAAQCRPGCLPSFRRRLHPGSLARRLRRSGRGLCQFPPRPHSARAWRAAPFLLQRPLQAHARRNGAEAIDRCRHRQRPRRLRMGLGLRSGWRMGQGTCCS